jgi:hypothetical protein
MINVQCSIFNVQFLRPRAGEKTLTRGNFILRCKGTTFALRLTNGFEEKIADLCCAAVLQFEIQLVHTQK